MTKATVTLRIATGEESTKEFLFERKKDAKRFKNMLEKGGLYNPRICTCSVTLEQVEPIG